MQIWAESGKSALPICNYSQILYQFLTFTQNLKRSLFISQNIRQYKTFELFLFFLLTTFHNIFFSNFLNRTLKCNVIKLR